MASAAPDDARVIRQLDSLFRGGRSADLSDARLIARLLDGPPDLGADAFARLVERHGAMVRRACRHILPDPNDADDAAQAAFLVLARRARSIRRRESIAAWLFGTAHRIARRLRSDIARRRDREQRGGLLMAEARHPEPAPADTIDRAEALRALDEELARLPEPLRGPLLLCHLESLTHEQAATQLGIPLRTLQRRLSQGRDRLRHRLTRRGLAPALALLAARVDAAPLPLAWLDATARAGTALILRRSAAGLATAAALKLAEEAARAMLRTQLALAATAALSALAASTALLPLALGQHPDDPPNPPEPPGQAAALAAPADAYDGPPPPDPRSVKPAPDIVTVTVVARDTGRPIPGATIRYSYDFTHPEVTTDTDGQALLIMAGRTFDRGRLFFDVWADGYVQQRHDYSNLGKVDPPIAEEIRVELVPGSESFAGVVRNPEGEPVAGARVEIWGWLAEWEDRREAAWMVRTTTDAEGRWRCSALRRMQWANLYISHPEYLSDNLSHPRVFVPRNAPPPTDEELNALRDGSRVDTLERGLPVEGRILDPVGRPVEGAAVRIAEAASTLAFYMPEARTDDDGHFRFPHARAGDVVLIVQPEGFAPGLKPVRIESGLAPIEFHLGFATPIRGRVTDPRGRPLQGVNIQANLWRGYHGLRVFLGTDADGRFEWDDAPPDAVEISAVAIGFLHETVTATGGAELAFVLKPSLEVAGKVRDAETVQKIENGQAFLAPIPPDGAEPDWDNGRQNSTSDGAIDVNADASASSSYRLRVTALGYTPHVSPELSADDVVIKYDVKLTRDRGNTVRVMDPTGNAVVNATVYLIPRGYGLDFMDGELPINQRLSTVTTGEDGTFNLPSLDGPLLVAVVGEDVYGDAMAAELERDRTIRVAPYGRVEGVLRIGAALGVNRKVQLSRGETERYPGYRINAFAETSTDEQGRFTFARIPPGSYRIGRWEGDGDEINLSDRGTLVDVKAGETTQLQIGGVGRPVVGRIVAPPGTDDPAGFFRTYRVSLTDHRPAAGFPIELLREPDALRNGEKLRVWTANWRSSEARREYLRRTVLRTASLSSDVTFRFEDVPAGDFRLSVELGAAARRPGRPAAGPAFRAHQTFNVPESPGGRSDEPVDLGPLSLWLPPKLEAGQPAPDFRVTTLDGKELTLADFRGNYLLLDFGGPWNVQSRIQVGRLAELVEKLGREERLAILSLTMDRDTPETRDYIEAKRQDWPQAIIGPPSPENGLARAFGVGDDPWSGPPVGFLIDPDGKLASAPLKYNEYEGGVSKVLDPHVIERDRPQP